MLIIKGDGGGPPNVNDTTKAYLVNLSTKGEGGQKFSKLCQRSLWMTPKNFFEAQLHLI